MLGTGVVVGSVVLVCLWRWLIGAAAVAPASLDIRTAILLSGALGGVVGVMVMVMA